MIQRLAVRDEASGKLGLRGAFLIAISPMARLSKAPSGDCFFFSPFFI